MVLEFISTLKSELMEEIHTMEQFVIKLHNIYAFACQVRATSSYFAHFLKAIFFIFLDKFFYAVRTTF